jgi:isoaspartyl peptidase/L-asparaginase-like protein (Ntn-hydrolase superfamily)
MLGRTLAGQGALQFASLTASANSQVSLKEIQTVPEQELVSTAAQQHWMHWTARLREVCANPHSADEYARMKGDTVGAIAMDLESHVAAGVSRQVLICYK